MIFQSFGINKTVLLSFTLIFIVINSYAVFYQTRVASNSLEIAKWTKTNNYHTDYGVIYLHVGDFNNYKPDSNVKVLNNIEDKRKTDSVIYSKIIDFIGVNITIYYVIKHENF